MSILLRCVFLWVSCVASCALATATSAAQTSSDSIAKPGEPVFFRKMYTNKEGNRMPYRVYVPENYDANKKYPLVIFFHGGGRGSNNEQQILHENLSGTHVWTLPAHQAQFPAFVLAPQCPVDENWGDPDMNDINRQMQMALQILAAVQKDYSIDADRIVLVGQSAGGLGVWALLQSFPEKWAAAVVVGSYDNFTDLRAIARVPLWLFQGDMDLTVPVVLVREMVRQLNKAHAQLRCTEYRKMNDEIWDRAFTEPDLVPWVAAQKRGAPAAAPAK
jgi:predicted peptidase